MKRLLSLALAASLTGCVSTMNQFSGLCQVEESRSSFDDSLSIKFTKCFSPTGYSFSDIPLFKYGFSWSESAPNYVSIQLLLESSVSGVGYTNFEAVHINLDGNVIKYPVYSSTAMYSGSYNSTTRNLPTFSSAHVSIPYELFESMLEANDVRLMIVSDDFSESVFFSERQIGLTKYARYYLDDYLIAINNLKKPEHRIK